MITNKRAFANTLKKQLNIHYDIPAHEVSHWIVENLSETIEFTKGNPEIISDHIHATFGQNKKFDTARVIATNILQHY